LHDGALDLKERGGVDIEYGEVPCISVAFSDNDEKGILKMMVEQESLGFYEGRWVDEKELKDLFPDINPLARGGGLSPALHVEPYRIYPGTGASSRETGSKHYTGRCIRVPSSGLKGHLGQASLGD
jgi:hypothetical protein